MTIKECIDKCDALNPNQYSEEMKVDWLSRLDYDIFNNIIQTHEYNEEEEEIKYEPYSVDNMSQQMIAPFPFDDLYVAYLAMKIDEANKDTAQYNNSLAFYNYYYSAYAADYNKKHMPINKSRMNNWRH